MWKGRCVQCVTLWEATSGGSNPEPPTTHFSPAISQLGHRSQLLPPSSILSSSKGAEKLRPQAQQKPTACRALGGVETKSGASRERQEVKPSAAPAPWKMTWFRLQSGPGFLLQHDGRWVTQHTPGNGGRAGKLPGHLKERSDRDSDLGF